MEKNGGEMIEQIPKDNLDRGALPEAENCWEWVSLIFGVGERLGRLSRIGICEKEKKEKGKNCCVQKSGENGGCKRNNKKRDTDYERHGRRVHPHFPRTYFSTLLTWSGVRWLSARTRASLVAWGLICSRSRTHLSLLLARSVNYVRYILERVTNFDKAFSFSWNRRFESRGYSNW